MLAKEKALEYIESRADETGNVEIVREEAKKAGIKGIGWRVWELMQEGKLKRVGGNRYVLVGKENTETALNTDGIIAVVALSPEEVKKYMSGEFTRLSKELKESQGEEAVKVFDKLMAVKDMLSGDKILRVRIPMEWDVVKKYVMTNGLALKTWEPGRCPASARETADAAKRKAS